MSPRGCKRAVVETPCRIGKVATEVSGAAIALMTESHPRTQIATTNSVGTPLDELQLVLGEGPCIDACKLAGPIAESDLANTGGHWPVSTPSARAASVRAIFGFPISMGSACIGVLSPTRHAQLSCR